MSIIKNKNKNYIPWVEKYRPKYISDLELNHSTLNKLNKMNTELDMPNLIITGVPGIGKTTTIQCLSRELLGKYKKGNILELNASDDRGIKAVHENIIHFCRKKLNIPELEKNNYCKHKIILLDEADNMTKKAQQLINNLIEKYRHTTRFAFTCNNSSDIIESIQSRCIIFRYKRLNKDQIKNKILKICDIENINYDKSGIDTIIINSQGDMRQAINCLQLTYDGYKNITADNVYKLCDKPHPIVIIGIFKNCYENKPRDALEKLKQLWNDGFSGSDLVLSMINTIKLMDSTILPTEIKIKYLEIITKTCMIISKGIDTKLQLTSCIANLCLLNYKHKILSDHYI
jgi:replication factor C subunit 2/4